MTGKQEGNTSSLKANDFKAMFNNYLLMLFSIGIISFGNLSLRTVKFIMWLL